MRIKTATPEARARAAQLKLDVSAYERLRANRNAHTRPLLLTETQMFSSGARALARDIKSGAYVPSKVLGALEDEGGWPDKDAEIDLKVRR